LEALMAACHVDDNYIEVVRLRDCGRHAGLGV